MATKIVGIGVVGTVAGNTVTFDREISGDGLTLFTTSHFLLNLSTVTSFAITAIARNASDRNKIVSVTVGSSPGTTGNFFALLTDSGTTTFTTITAAHSAASSGDEIIVYPRSSFGDRQIRLSTGIGIAKNVTVETDTIGERNIIVSFDPTQAFVLTSACTIRDFYVGSTHADVIFRIHHTSGLVVIERCIAWGGDNGGSYVHQAPATADLTYKNCIALFGRNDGFQSSASAGTIKHENCAALYTNGRGFSENGGITMTCDNCVSYRNVTNYFGTITGDNNVSDTGSIPTGSGNLTLQTLDKIRPAFDFITGQPTDFRFLDGGNSVLEDGGKVIAGLTLDIDGRTRDGTTPNIGPTEDFTRFGTGGRQTRARYHNV